MEALILSNVDPMTDHAVFSSERGSWNVSRAARDCAAGKYPVFIIDVEEAHAANKNIEVDEDKVKRFMRNPEVFETPAIAVEEDGAHWFIDGHHRLRALHRLRVQTYACYLIPEKDSEPYRILYNGKRIPPWGFSFL